MAAVSGEWARQNLNQQATAMVWGTGINPVHYYYGSPVARGGALSLREGESVPPSQAVPDPLIPHDLWGYTPEDSTYTGVQYDRRPSWDNVPSEHRAETFDHPSWSAPGSVNERFRAVRAGARRLFRSADPRTDDVAYVVPSETVSEGWLNKPHGQPSNAKPSDPVQYEIQTSMTQRYQARNNRNAVGRSTDSPREIIESRVVGKKVKVYSGGERHYDMFPREQDDIPRPFYYRTAGTGPLEYMPANTTWSITPIERTPPPDPSMGVPEPDIQDNFGYTDEENFYA